MVWTCIPRSWRTASHLPFMGERKLNRGTTLPNLDPDSQAADRVMNIPRCDPGKKEAEISD